MHLDLITCHTDIDFKFNKQPSQVFCKKKKTALTMILQYSQKITCTGVPFFNKVIKKRLQHRCFPVNIAKSLIKPILKNICLQLLLKFVKYSKTQPAFTCSKLTIETLKQDVKYVQT